MVGRTKGKKAPKNKGKPCSLCGAGMPVRDGHDACVVCLGVDHAVLAANAAGDCDVCAGLPKEIKAARLLKVRKAYEVAEDDGEPQEAEEELPGEEDPMPARARSTRSRASSRPPPVQQDDAEEEQEEDCDMDPEYESRHYDDGSRYEGHYDADDDSEEVSDGVGEEEEPLHGSYSARVAAEVRAAIRYEREREARSRDAAPAADPVQMPEAAAPQERKKLPPLKCDESDPIDIFKNAAECCGVPWPAPPSSSAVRESSIFRAFGGDVEPRRERLVLPVVQDFMDVLTASWKNPAKDKLVAPLLQRFETEGAKEAGLKSMPPMDRHVAEHLLRKGVPSGRDPVLEGSREQNISKLVKAAYASSAAAAEAVNALAMLQYATFSLLHDIKEKPTLEQILMLRRLQREQTDFTVHVAAATGKAMAQLVQVERSRWLKLSTIDDAESAINQEVKPGSLFSESPQEMVSKYEENKKRREALKVLIPTAPPKTSFAKRSTYGSSRGGRSWSRDRFGAPRPGPSGAPRPGPASDQQPDRSGGRPAKRRLQHADPAPAPRGRGRGRGTRGASTSRSAK